MKNLLTRTLGPTPKLVLRQVVSQISTPIFLSLALIGNSIILSGATIFYFLERAHNPRIHSFLDTLWWAVATVTTVGYGDVSPVTSAGKWMGIGMMLLGTTLFCSFTALFSAAILSFEVKEVEKSVKDIRDEVSSDEKLLDEHLNQIDAAIKELRLLRGKRR